MHDHGSTYNTPRWVRAVGISVIVLLLVFVGLDLIGGSLLGQGHSGHGDHAPPSSVTEHGPRQP